MNGLTIVPLFVVGVLAAGVGLSWAFGRINRASDAYWRDEDDEPWA